MLPLTQEWVDKAEGDFSTLQRELRARKSPNYDAACFHAQQCAENYMKAQLQELGTSFAKSHNLVALLDVLLPSDASWDSMRADLANLTTSAVEIRYPGETADRDDAKEAARICKLVRSRVRASLGLT